MNHPTQDIGVYITLDHGSYIAYTSMYFICAPTWHVKNSQPFRSFGAEQPSHHPTLAQTPDKSYTYMPYIYSFTGWSFQAL